jgi:hypothetical protein
MYDAGLSFTASKGCFTCISDLSDVSTLLSPEGSSNPTYSFEYYGTIMSDNLCLVLDPQSPTCALKFNFFSIGDWNNDISGQI